MSSQIFPEVRDHSAITARRSQPLYLPIGVEGWADTAGDAVVGTVYTISRPSDSDKHFGPVSVLGTLIKYLLGRGVQTIYAVASAKGLVAPTLVQRQAVWASLESHPLVRLRMTSDTAQATLVALARSCENADLIFNKQIGFGGMVAGTAKSALISAAEAIGSKRFVFAGPGVYDMLGNLMSGNYLSAAFAAAVAQNPDISDDLNLLTLPNLTGIELDVTGMPIFTKRVAGGVAVNDFEDLLQGGVSPAMTDPTGGGVRLVHLRTTWVGSPPGSDTSYDALMTALIIDQLFLDVRDYATNNKFLSRGNTPTTRADLQAGIVALLIARSSWLQMVTQADGTQGYNVSVDATPDMRGVTIHYEGTVVRGISTIDVDASFTIPV